MTISIRTATRNDIKILTKHRELMFKEMGLSEQNKELDEALLEIMAASYAKYVLDSMEMDQLWGWVAEVESEIVASGILSLMRWPPGIGESHERAGLLHSLYTDVKFRRLGIARSIIDYAITAARKRNLKWITLGASDAGKPLYEKLGFRLSTGTRMHLVL
jgi:GNAT superfamily N-acetyltransferase